MDIYELTLWLFSFLDEYTANDFAGHEDAEELAYEANMR